MAAKPRVQSRKPMMEAPPPIRGRVTIRIERCKGCEFCIEFCPQGVLETSTDFNPKGYHYPIVVKDECINCTSCLTLCPDYAIFSEPKPVTKKLPAKKQKPAKSNRGSNRELRSAK